MQNLFWTPGMTMDDVEESVITSALRFYHNNKTATAEALGISLRTLHNKIAKYSGEPMLEEEEVVEVAPKDLPKGNPEKVQPKPNKRHSKKKSKGVRLSA